MEKALAHNSLDAIEKIYDLLRLAPHIVVLGESFAAPVAESFARMLADAGLPALYVTGDVYDRARALVIGITPLEGPSGVARALIFARDEGAVTLACTPSLSSQTARAAEYLLYAPGETAGTLPSLSALYALLMSIAQTLAEAHLDVPNRRNEDEEINRVLEKLS
jgi:DNA-binding MurR/RpiR family transcriptional regulator